MLTMPRLTESHPDGSTMEYDYNAAGLLTMQKEVMAENRTRRQITYGYDDAGNLTSENRSGVDIDKKDELVRYYYDGANQLVKTMIEGVTTNYTYDLSGNLISDGTHTYTYDLQNRLLTKAGADGTTAYAYGATYDSDDWKDLEAVWKSIKYDNDYNIDMVGLVLSHKRSAL